MKWACSFLILLLLLSLTSELWMSWSPFEPNLEVSSYPSEPSWQNWLGTDTRGRDLLARLIVGFKYSFGFGLSVWFLSSLLAFISGAWLGYIGGRWDLYGQRFIEVLESMPLLLILIFLSTVLTANIYLLIFVSSVLGWMNLSYYVRAEVLKLKHSEFVLSAQASGASHWNILFKHILPHAVFPLLLWMPFTIASCISFLAGIDYLGFGLPAPTPSWGELLQQAFSTGNSQAWWLKLYPIVFLMLVLFCLYFMGRAFRRQWLLSGQ